MNKLKLICLILIGQFLLAQNEQFVGSWTLIEFNVNGEDLVPLLHDYAITLNINEDLSYETDWGNQMWGNFVIDETNSILSIDGTGGLFCCETFPVGPYEQDYSDVSGAYFTFFDSLTNNASFDNGNCPYTLVQSGNLRTLTITNLEGDVAVYTATALSVDDFNKELNSIKIYPNPVVDYFSVEGIGNLEGISIFLYNLKGEKMLTVNNQIKDIQISNLIQGVYLLEIWGIGSQLWQGKLIKK